MSENAHGDAAEKADLVLGHESEVVFALIGQEVIVEDAKPTSSKDGWMRFEGSYSEDPNKNLDLWRSTEEMLGSIVHFPETLAYERLANFAAVAFGGTSLPVEHGEFTESFVRYSPPARPEGRALRYLMHCTTRSRISCGTYLSSCFQMHQTV